MRNLMTITLLTALLTGGNALMSQEAVLASADDWTQWRGPNTDGAATYVLETPWPEDGPAEVWRRPLGSGFSGISILDGRLYTMYTDGDDEYLACMDAAAGEELWRVRTGDHFRDWQGGNGPRTTPILHDGKVYTLSAHGQLWAVDAVSGEKVWKVDLPDRFGARQPKWGFSATPLIEDSRLLIDVGGPSGYSAMAFDPADGSVLWHSGGDIPGYSSPVTTTIGGVKQALFFTGTKVTSVAVADGRPLWEYPWETSYEVNAATPIIIPGDRVFLASGYSTGGGMLQVEKKGDDFSARAIWTTPDMKNQMATSIYHDGYLYGFNNGIFVCLDAETGLMQWRARGFGKGTLLRTGDNLIVLGERGNLALVATNPSDYTEIRDAGQVIEGRCWTVPTLVDGKLYLRSLEEIACLDLRNAAR